MNFSYNRDGSPSGSESEDDGMEWEEVVNKQPVSDAPAAAPSMTGPTSDQASTSKAASSAVAVAGPAGNDEIQVTLKAGSTLPTSVTNSRKKGKGRPSGFSAQAALERAQRQELHKVHAACLLISGHVRNGWLNDQSLQGRLMSKVPLSLQNKFHEYSKTTHPKATDRSRLFEAAMKSLLTWWSEKFHLEDDSIDKEKRLEGDLFDLLTSPHSIETFPYPGMAAMLSKLSLKDRTRLLMPFASEEELQKLVDAHPPASTASSSAKKKAKPPKLPKLVSAEYGELIRNPQSLAKRAVKMSGTRDMSAQLFTALCRALDIPARLVCNLPVVDYRSATKVAKDEKTIEQRTGSGKKRKRASGTASASASVENSFEEDNTQEDDEDDADFEEVQIPASLPSKAFNKAAKRAGNPADSGAATQKAPARATSRAKAKNAAQTIMSARKGKARAASLDIDDDDSYGLPIFWTEVYNRSLQEWIPLDAVRNKLRFKKGEMDGGNLFYVVAYEVDQYVKDVTPRYAKSYAGRTLKMRISSRKKDDPDWWEETVRPWQRPFMLGRERKEDEDLQRNQETEPMPTVLEGFKNHPRYALERHLKREEVFAPRTKQLGLFRGEPVFPRSAVIAVKSSETWMREGRRIKESEQPLKLVKQRAVTINKRRAQEMAEQEGMDPIMQGLYSASQTELVIPPPIVDGKIPKNSYGNLDLFAPHMLPRGAVHLPFKTIKKVAKDLGIEFAEAVTGFEFHKRRAVPTVVGIVIAAEHETMVLDAYWASESVAAEKELQKRKERCLKRWKKLIVGLRVRNRIQGEYKKDKSKSGSASKTSGSGNVKAEESERSQFQPLQEDKDLPKAKVNMDSITQPPDASATSNGFIHNSSLHASEPGGAAFPPPPDLNGVKLPPMPAPEPRTAFNDVDMDLKVGYPANLNGHEEKTDLSDFTLLPPEELAEGAPEIGESESEGGGFIREDEEDDKPETKGIVKRDFAKKNGRQAKQAAKAETSESEVDMEEVQVSKDGSATTSDASQDEDESVDEEAAYEGSPSPSPPPAKKTRTTRAAARSSAKSASEKAPVANGQSSRRSTRAATSSSPAKTASNGRKPARPARAAATRARQAAVIDIGSSEEGEGDEEEEADD